ncbi:ArsR/SmtB family transcription factor [Halococcus salifodinae]|uniref:ArsR family transcriptional regulator n=1 Tax=Halococcus salifodinae DSM 8989 TaxID=1227456 RepID=M0N9E5_9EURY|nr:metalloregulator ArsR/SmtB family transcription factor [Halococcus salifodinae]EMA53729.1 ArsR family transcriptional regulator [Halococcus salifodinae DSM 8989]
MVPSTDRLRRLIADEIGECCEEDVEQRLDDLDSLAERATTDRLDRDRKTMAALGSETRHRIARLLVTADDALCVCELQPLVDVSESAISHALSDLVDAGLVSRDRRGKWRYYESTGRAERVFAALDAAGDDE